MADNSKDIKRRNKNWSDTNEIRALIYIWEENIEDLIKTKRNRFIYERISTELRGFGFRRSLDEIRSKIKNLSAMYRREKLMYAQTGNPSEWLYYESIHRFLDQNRSYSEELLNESADISPQEMFSFSTESKDEEPLDVVSKKKIKEEPIEHVDIDDVVLPEPAKSHSDIESLPHSQIQGLKNIEKIQSSPQKVADSSSQKLLQIQNVEKTTPLPQSLVFLLPRQFVNQKIQNVEKFPPLPQSPADSVSKQSKIENAEKIPLIPHPVDEKLKHSKDKVKHILNDPDSEEEETDPVPSKRRRRSFESALENLPLTLQSSILERLDTLSRHIETNTCAVSVLSKAVGNISDSTVRVVSAVNNLSKSLNNIGSMIERLIQSRDE